LEVEISGFSSAFRAYRIGNAHETSICTLPAPNVSGYSTRLSAAAVELIVPALPGAPDGSVGGGTWWSVPEMASGLEIEFSGAGDRAG
jgi:hypothetical protein